MIITQYPYIDEYGNKNTNLVMTYSNINKKILQIDTNNIYDKAIDIYPSKFTYIETEEDIEVEEINTTQGG